MLPGYPTGGDVTSLPRLSVDGSSQPGRVCARPEPAGGAWGVGRENRCREDVGGQPRTLGANHVSRAPESGWPFRSNAFLRAARLLLARDLEPFSRLEHDGRRAGFTLDPGGPGAGILSDRREGVVMDGQNVAWLEQLDGTNGIVGTHRVVVADRQDRQIEPFLADQGHIAEKSGVRRVIQLDSIGAGDEEAAGVSPVAAIGKRRAVECQGQLDANSAVERVEPPCWRP